MHYAAKIAEYQCRKELETVQLSQWTKQLQLISQCVSGATRIKNKQVSHRLA